MSKCKSCGAEITWIKTTSGKSMPCDAQAVTYWIDKNGAKKDRIVTPNGEVVACDLDGLVHTAVGIGYIPHWSTCPNADRHKKKGG